MTRNDLSVRSEYLDYLPAAFAADDAGGAFLGRFLLAFQRLLTGLPGTELGEGEEGAPGYAPAGLEQILDRIHIYFLPGPGLPAEKRAPDEFLPWLAGWVATSLREDWPAETKRKFIQQAPALYARRGTKSCLWQMLTFFLGEDKKLVISDDEKEPFCFSVSFRVAGPEELRRYDRIARSIIDREKPAHTYYRLRIESPCMEIVDRPRTSKDHEGLLLGTNTWLGVGELNK